MKLSKMSYKHWRNKLSEAVEAFVVLTQKAGSALDQVRETALIGHTLIMQAEPLVLNATETLFHVKKACHSFSSFVDSLGKIDAALTNLQAHIREQDKNREKAALLEKVCNAAFDPRYPSNLAAIVEVRKILRHDGVEDWTVKPAEYVKLTPADIADAFQAPASMMNERLTGSVKVTTTKICHICQEEAHYTDLDTGKFLCGKHSPLVSPL